MRHNQRVRITTEHSVYAGRYGWIEEPLEGAAFVLIDGKEQGSVFFRAHELELLDYCRREGCEPKP